VDLMTIKISRLAAATAVLALNELIDAVCAQRPDLDAVNKAGGAFCVTLDLRAGAMVLSTEDAEGKWQPQEVVDVHPARCPDWGDLLVASAGGTQAH
jgi:hypothetical protein